MKESMPEIHLQVVAGLANRLRSLVSGICLAEDCSASLVIHWSPSDPACAASFEALFDVSTLPSFVSLSSLPLLKYFECLSSDQMEFARTHWDRSKPLLLKSYGHFHTEDMVRWCTHLRTLRARPEFYKTLGERLPPLDPGSFLGVHIRRGDNEKAIQMSPYSKFVARLEKENKVFVVATDDLAVQKDLMQRFPGRVWFPSKVLNRTTEEGMKEALIDFLALSTCKHILGSMYSSFNEIAALYGGCLLERIT